MNIAFTDNRQARVAYDDLREWINEAEKLGELVRANGYSWQEDIGMAAELLQHDAKAPVALFDDIPGYPKGFRVLTNFFGGRRQNMTLGFSPDLNKIELSEAFLADFQKISDKPLPYQVVETGPVMENVIEGDAVDVTRFPTPVWHDRDEGRRYIGTGSFNVTRDPDENWVNAGTYRVMIHDAKRLGFYISPGKHGRIHRDKYQALNQPMPVCIVIGGDPLTFLMTCTEVPYGTCEYRDRRRLSRAAAEGRHRQAYWLAHSGQRRNRHRGLRAAGQHGAGGTVRRMDRLLWLEDAQRAGARHQGHLPPQRPDPARLPAATAAGGTGALSRGDALGAAQAGTEARPACPTWSPPGATRPAARASSPRCRSSSAILAMPAKPATSPPCAARRPMPENMWSSCDDDIDVSNLEQLMWAVCSRSDPATSIDFIRGAWSTPLDPSIDPERKEKGDFTNSRAIIDACRPFHWKDKYPIVNMPLPETARKTKEMFSWMLDGIDQKTKGR